MNGEIMSVVEGDFGTKFKLLDQLLRCGICYEYFNVCMLTSCGHNYCSLCIRKYMSYKTQCPTCFHTTCEPELKNNRLVDEIVENFITIRDKMLQFLDTKNTSCVIEDKIASCQTLPKSPKRLRSRKVSTSPKKDTDVCCDFPPAKAARDLPRESDLDPLQSCNDSQKEAVCPVCSVEIPLKNINRHLDDCLGRSESNEVKETQNKNSHAKRMPKLIYRFLKDSEIRTRLNKLGLQSTGTREEIIRRHQAFTLLFNANLDSKDPQSQSHLKKQLAAEEEARVKTNRCLNFNRNSDPKTIEKEQARYRKKHETQYKELINNIQIQRKNHPRKKKDDVVSPSPKKLVFPKLKLVNSLSSESSDDSISLLSDFQKSKRFCTETAKSDEFKEVYLQDELSVASTSATRVAANCEDDKVPSMTVVIDIDDESSRGSLVF